LTLPGLEPRTLSRPARSQSLYQLRYPGSHNNNIVILNTEYIAMACNSNIQKFIKLAYEIFLIGIVGGGAHLGPLGTAATNRPIVSAPGDYDDGEIGGMIGRGTEVLGENVPQCRFVHCNPHMLPGRANPGRRGGKPESNRLSYGTA
jgi:hypothetical protein